MASMLAATIMLCTPSVHAAGDVNGTFRVQRLAGIVYVNDESFAFPPEGILAAVLGRDIKVKGGRIRVGARYREDIVKVIRRDPRLSQVWSFSIKVLPRFDRFNRAENGVWHAATLDPLIMEVRVGSGPGGTVTARVDYQARMRGKRLWINVDFRGMSGEYQVYMGQGWDRYRIRGSTRILAKRR